MTARTASTLVGRWLLCCASALSSWARSFSKEECRAVPFSLLDKLVPIRAAVLPMQTQTVGEGKTVEIPYPDNMLISKITTACLDRWPQGSAVMPSERIDLHLTYAEVRAVLTALQLQASVRLAIGK